MNAGERLTPTASADIRDEIASASGNEVIFLGHTDPDGKVREVSAVGRGDISSVPAPLPHMEKGDVILHNHPSGVLTPSRADINVASELANLGIGSFIVNNEASELYVVVEPVILPEIVPLDPEPLVELVSDSGRLKSLIPSYEARESQMEMMRMIIRGLNENRLSAAEAGTGVGKSFAYLIPAIAWVDQNEERVVVSTATINLQHQLADKDVPLVKKLLSSDAKVALVKGRANYLCLNRLQETIEEEGEMFLDPGSELHAIREWSRETASGSRSDLPFMPTEQLWSQVCADADSCSGLRCRNREGCFLLRARREAAAARVLIVNHHLLFSDLAMRLHGLGYDVTGVLPPFNHIVFDEAHNIEDSATSYFSESFSRLSLYKYLSRLQRTRRGRTFGLLYQLERIAGERLPEVPVAMAKIRTAAESLDASAMTLLEGGSTKRFSGEPTTVERVSVLEPMVALQQEILDLATIVEDCVAGLSEDDRELPEVYDVRLAIRRLEEVASVCQRFQEYAEVADHIFWMERARNSGGEPYVRFTITPLEIASVMQEAVFEPYESVSMTSATLTVSKSFDYWASRVGLDRVGDDGYEARSFPSPFPYRTRVLLGVPTDAPPPESPEYQRFLSKFVLDAIEISEGRALALFTSYEMLLATYNDVRDRLSELNITLFRQGEDERTRLLTRFKKDVASVLFATDSFWEGVDTPGEALELVIICRLPFRVPTDPILVARTEAVRRRGGNPFMELSLPDAAMRLKQGFGRLMRRKTDRGVVLITDSRIISKSYGALFLETLPETARSVKPSDLILRDMEDFLYDPTAPSARIGTPNESPAEGADSARADG